MPRPRSNKVKLVVELLEITYQRLAVRAYNDAKSVDNFVRDLVEKETDKLVSLPLIDLHKPIVAPALPLAAPSAQAEEQKKQKK